MRKLQKLNFIEFQTMIICFYTIEIRRPSSTVVLPLSLAEDLGDSEDEDDNAGLGSDFDESDVVDESEIYEIIGEPRDDCGDVSLVFPIKFCFFT